MKKIIVDLEKLKKTVKKGKDIFITPKAEKEILKLLEIQEQVNEMILELKEEIEKEALKVNKNFTAIKSDNLKIFYRAYGSRYVLDESRINEVDKSLYKKQVKFSIVTKVLDKYIKENGGKLPLGIQEKDRKKTISINRLYQDEE